MTPFRLRYPFEDEWTEGAIVGPDATQCLCILAARILAEEGEFEIALEGEFISFEEWEGDDAEAA